ncbi:helix-turn-helix domain-containing protein [Natronolimnobius baerhuensis]|uniref:Bacterio-opsin activator n=1 Tax=Natronolimnobius baerhuensis TaxID=253108 RepID=A0A202EBJ1_9EURY|nr:helix-turn-helix domain-containing protein [Natronolimnobius baerhuensis]OVE85340.1 bacterio-opsin activator [Natronolimnobius baerhuensis]
MKRVRITLRPTGAYAPPIYELLAGDADYLEQTHIVNWNVATPPTTFLLWLRGDYRRFGDVLETHETVHDYEILPLSARECHCFFQGEVATAARALFKNFTQGSLMTVPPIECNDDGSNTFTLIGSDTDIQAAVDGVPDGVSVTVDAVGGAGVAPERVLDRLAPRQREAIKIALERGYYDAPRRATIDEIAEELECATATAAEHLQKGESVVIAALFDG